MSTIITPITMPFASGRASGTLPNVIPAIEPHSSIDNVANQTTGFPVLQATSLSGGGIPVQEGEMNGVLNFYTNLLFQMGQGYQFTFDAALSSKITGYPAGAILWCASNKTYQLSLKNNNTADFVTTPSFINDGVNWQNLVNAGEFPDIRDDATTGSVTIGGKVIGGTQTLEGLAADGNTATVVAYGNSGGSGTGSVFVGVLNPSFIPVSGFQINTIGRPYIAGDITVTNKFNAAILGDCTHTHLMGNVHGGGTYSLNMQKIRMDVESYSISISGSINDVPYVGQNSGYIDLPLTRTTGVSYGALSLTTIHTNKVCAGEVFTDSGAARIYFGGIAGAGGSDYLTGGFSIIFTGF
ncbi:MAG: hypothetical protein RIQ70_149 [Bacteroidota bacterium]|jgi:hypothetical protein